jgi:hypothetical protein
MSQEKNKIISDLVRINKYRSHLANPEKFFSQDMYTDQSIEDLKKIHDIYTRYLLDYKNLRDPYPKVIESLEYTNEKISSCVSEHQNSLNQ